MTLARRCLLLATLACAAACAGSGGGGESGEGASTAPPPAPNYSEAAAALASCPRGDKPWRAALAAATAAGKLDELAALVTTLTGSCAGRWEPSWAAGEIRFRANPPAARPDYDEALRRARSLQDPVGIACSANRIGALAYRSGDLSQGESLYKEALAAALRAQRDDLAAFIRNNLAGLLLEKGEYALAREELEHAAEGLEALGLSEAAHAAAFNRAVIFAELGDSIAAGEALERLHAEAAKAGDDATLREAAITLAKLHLATDRLADAERWFEQARGGDADIDALAELGLGRVALARGDLAAARTLLTSAAGKARARERLFELIAETRLAEAEMLAGSQNEARSRLRRVIERSDAKGAEESAWAARWTLGRLEIRERRWGPAIEQLEAALRILEGQKKGLDPLGAGLYFLRERAGPYADLAYALAVAPRLPDREARVLAIAARMKARALRRALGAAAPGEGSEASADLASIRAGLETGELLLDYVVGEEHGVVLALSARAARVATLPGRREFGPRLRAYLDSLRPGATEPDTVAGLAVRGALLEPVADLVSAASRLYFVPDREIALLPMAALPLEGGGFVGDRLEVAVLPLAGAPARFERGAARTPLLLAGQPVQDAENAKAFPPLPWASFELSSVRSVWGEEATTLLTGAAFDVESLVRALSDDARARPRTVHLATHAVASTQDPRRCGVIASNGARLGIEDVVRRLHLAPGALVILSACRTGVGEVVPGEGVIGLGWSFLRAGAGGIVVSHWTVDDVSAARLMIAFHKRLAAGEDPVRSLALATRELAASSKEYRSPQHWAPFVIVLRPEIQHAQWPVLEKGLLKRAESRIKIEQTVKP